MKETLLIKKFKDGILEMTEDEKSLWFEVNTSLLAELNEKEFKTKAGYRRESEKIYGKTIKEYYKRKIEQICYKTLYSRAKDALDYTDNLTLQEKDFVLNIIHKTLKTKESCL